MNPPTKFVYLNFEGVTLQTGQIPDPATNTWTGRMQMFAPFLASHPQREAALAAIVSQTTEMLAPYDIGVVRERPAEKYMMIVFTGPPEENGAKPDSSGDGGNQCGLSAYSRIVSTQYELPDITDIAALANVHSFQTVAEVGLGHGVANVTLAGNCMCWSADSCFQGFDYFAQRCTIEGTAMIDPNAVCPHTATELDVAAEFRARLKPHP